MTQDPIQPLTEIGRRVLQTVRYLATSPIPDQPLESYESQSRDPVVVLSAICNELLERLAAAPVAEDLEDLPNEPGSRLDPAPNQGSAFPTFSRAGAALTRTAADRRDEAADSRRENQATEQSDTPGLADTSPFEESRRSIDDPVPSQDESGSRDLWEEVVRESGGAAPQTDNSEAPLRPIGRGAPRARTIQPPAASDGEPSQADLSSETRPPARQEWPDPRQIELPSDMRGPGAPGRAENGSVRGPGESDVSFPLHGSRLTGSTERLAALLRSHAAQPEPATTAPEKESQEGKDVCSSRQGDDERDASRIMDQRTRSAGRAGIEEIMERLADELETEFVRTYGSSGG